MRQWVSRTALVVACLMATPLAAQLTIEIPRDQIDALKRSVRGGPPPPIELDFSTADGLLKSIEDVARTDWMEWLPQPIADQFEGFSAVDDHRKVVWQMTVSGGWNETVSGTGVLNVLELGDAHAGSRQLHALLDADTRDWPFHLTVRVPPGAAEVSRQGFSGTTALGALTNHWFDADRLLGYASPSGMHTPGFSELKDGYYYTKADSGVVRVDQRQNTYRLSFRATVSEHHSEARRPTGRMATVQGWVCEATTYHANPELCLHEPLQLLAVTPESQRENVNFQKPEITLAFTDPVDLDTLESSFALYTYDAAASQRRVEGNFETRGNATYAFLPNAALPDATRFEARVQGGPNGVTAKNREEFLDQTQTWRFSTLVDPTRDAVAEDGNPILLDVYQTVRNAPLVIDKPSLLRATPLWNHREDIHPSWQVRSFPATVEADVDYVRVAGQLGEAPQADGSFRIRHQDVFNHEHRHYAVNTVNLFGWRPPWNGPNQEVSARIEPFNPWPEPLEQTVFETTATFSNWPVEPQTLTVSYAFLEAGSWAEGVPPEVIQRTKDIMREASTLSTQLFPVAATQISPIRIPGVNGSITREFLYIDYDDQQVSSSDIIFENVLWDLNQALDTNVLWEAGARAPTVVRRAAERLRWLLSLHRSSTDTILLLYPPEVASAGRATGIGDFFSTHKRNRGLGMVIHPEVDNGQLAMGVVHEIGHALGLEHNPGDLEEILELHPRHYRDPGMEGFRLALDGSYGWNKSAEHGNAEEPTDVLTPLMWPSNVPINWVWLNTSEYAQVQAAYGSAAAGMPRWGAWAPRGPLRLAAADNPNSGLVTPWFANLMAAKQAVAPTNSHVAVLGSIHPEGTRASIHYIGRTSTASATDGGEYEAALIDAHGNILNTVAFDPPALPPLTDSSYHRMAGEAAGDEESAEHAALQSTARHNPADLDHPAWWQDFMLTIPFHPEATTLIIRRGDTILAERLPPATSPAIEPTVTGLDLRDGPASLNWVLRGDQPQVDLSYSPNGESHWQTLMLGALATGARIDPQLLQPGPAPTLRLVARDGLAEAKVSLPVWFDRPPVPVATTGEPITAVFDTEIAPASLEHIEVLGPDASAVSFEASLSPDGRFLSIWPEVELPGDGSSVVRLRPGFANVLGQELTEPYEWTLNEEPG